MPAIYHDGSPSRTSTSTLDGFKHGALTTNVRAKRSAAFQSQMQPRYYI